MPVGSHHVPYAAWRKAGWGGLEVLEEASWLAFPLYSLLGVDFSLNQWFLTGGDFSSTRQHRPTLPFGNIWDFFFLRLFIYLFWLHWVFLLRPGFLQLW